MAKPRSYWQKRFELLEDAQYNKSASYYKDLEKAYIQTMAELEKDITRWYQRFATNNEISLDEAKQLLKSNELKELQWSVEEYIKYGQENALNQKWMKQLENASSRVHISRLESLQLQLQQHVERLYGEQIEGFERLIKEVYQDQYYHAAIEIQKGFEVGFALQVLDEAQLTKIISKPWTADGATFSGKIWRDKNMLLDTLHTELIQSIARGESPHRMISVVQKKMNTSRSNAARLVMTESAFFSAAAQKDAFGALDVEKYEIIATLDSRTSDICQSMDGKVFKLSVFEPGVTANPFHPRCRTTTAPYFEDDYSQRLARGLDGKTYHVPGNMTYKEWYNEYVLKPKELAERKEKEKQEKLKAQIKDDIRNGQFKLNHSKNRYDNHNPRHKRYAEYIERNKSKGLQKPSYLTISFEETNDLVKKYSGSGSITLKKNGTWDNKELIISSSVIGIHVNQGTGVETPTKAFYIHYSKTGTHIVPTLVDEE
ncbi:minor capsid protein [Psychrobacillus sp. NEAU-3TGS]|uniref:minor capsid protein n=1 Tax=Psychrobacillus sp. NEAU-3TGS TaxID=2995412 RepID=UPI00249783AD|nr:minor capsid protein [Psychrobacillus sp. NEAU-3TGS]MDI2588057.1 minor capsid protein [Psychrobacillus sp. NEAU-3TGS]